MRKIKFRGKRIDNGEWVFGCLIDYSVIKQISHGKLCILHESGSCEVDPDTVGQLVFTFQGQEFYEGDIIEYDGERILIDQPEWFECDAFTEFGYSGLGSFTDNYDSGEPSRVVRKGRLVGTIHDKVTEEAV